MNLDDFFGLHKGGVPKRAVFVNRDDEKADLQKWLAVTTSRVFGRKGIQQRGWGASNVRVLIASGGLGKSALAQEVVSGFASDKRTTRVAATIDFDTLGNREFETVLLRLRAALGTLGGQWPAFDIAFAAYWSATRGRRLDQYIQKATFLRPEERAQLGSQASSILGSVLGSYGTLGAGYQAVRLTRERLIEHQTTKLLLAEVPAFEKICLAIPPDDDPLGYFATLLAYDLECHRIENKSIQVLCVLDTLEAIQESTRRSVEDLVSRLVFLMPNVAFIIGTRKRLTWDQDQNRRHVFFDGPSKWPSLADGSAYVDVEHLEPQFAREYLETALVRGSNPVIPPEIREHIVKHAAGWPLYLDLSVERYQMLLRNDVTPRVKDFGGTMTELVQRIMRDMSAAERDLLRAACILNSFSQPTIRAALPSARSKDISTFLSRTFVSGDPSTWPAYRIHDRLRESVRKSDTELSDGWTNEDWQERALAVANYLEDEALSVWAVAADQVEFESRSQRVVTAAIHLVDLATTFDVEPPRLGEVLFTASQLGHGPTLRTLPNIPAKQPSLRAVVETARMATDNSDAKRRFHELAIHLNGVKNPRYARFVRYELGPAAQDSEQYDAAVEQFAALSGGEDDPMSQMAKVAYAGALLRRGQLKSALDFDLTGMPAHPLYESIVADLHGHIRMQGGHWQEAADLFTQAYGYAQECGSSLWTARSRRHMAKARMWYDPKSTLDLAEDALELNTAIGDTIGIAQCHMALGVAHAYLGSWTDARNQLQLAKANKVSALAVGHTGMVETLFNLVAGDARQADLSALSVLRSFHNPGGCPPVWCAVTAMWANKENLASFDNVEWYDSAGLARERWMRPLEKLRAP